MAMLNNQMVIEIMHLFQLVLHLKKAIAWRGLDFLDNMCGTIPRAIPCTCKVFGSNDVWTSQQS